MLAVCAFALSAGCGDEDGDATALLTPAKADTSDPRDVIIEMRTGGYHPTTARMEAGGRVTWVNTGTRVATAEIFPSEPGHFDTHTLYRGQAKSIRMERPGRYEYHSSYDSETFTGVLIVEPRDR